MSQPLANAAGWQPKWAIVSGNNGNNINNMNCEQLHTRTMAQTFIMEIAAVPWPSCAPNWSWSWRCSSNWLSGSSIGCFGCSTVGWRQTSRCVWYANKQIRANSFTAPNTEHTLQSLQWGSCDEGCWKVGVPVAFILWAYRWVKLCIFKRQSTRKPQMKIKLIVKDNKGYAVCMLSLAPPYVAAEWHSTYWIMWFTCINSSYTIKIKKALAGIINYNAAMKKRWSKERYIMMKRLTNHHRIGREGEIWYDIPM